MAQASGSDKRNQGTGGAIAGARMSLALLLLINLINYVDRYVLSAVEIPIRNEFFKPDDPNAKAWTGSLAFAFLISYMLTAPVFGWLADRSRRWAIVGVGVLLWTLASGGSGLATTFVVLLATRLLVGVGEGAYGPVAPALISDMYPVQRRGAVLAWFYMAIPVGSALGYALGGWIGGAAGWRWAFFAVVPPGLLLGAMCFLRRDPPRGASENEGDASAKRAAKLADYKVLLRTPSYVLNVLGMTAMTFAIGGVSFWMPTYIEEYRGLKTVALFGMNLPVSVVFGGITAFAGLTATLAGGWVGDKLRGRFGGSYLAVSGIAMLVGFPLFIAVMYVPFPLCWWVMLAAIFCLFFNTGPSNTAIANVSHPALRSTAYAACIFVIHALGDAISPVIIGFVAGHTRDPSQTPPRDNLNAGFLVVSLMILAGGVLWLIGARYLARDTANAHRQLDSQAAGG